MTQPPPEKSPNESTSEASSAAAPRRKPPARRGLWLMASLLLTFVVALPVTFLAMPWVHRWQLSRQIMSDDLATRGKALNVVALKADDDPHVRAVAIEALAVEDDVHFQQIFHALDMAGQWRRPPISNDAWFRWLELLGTAEEAEARIMAIRQTTQMRDLASDPRLIALFRQWLVEEDPLVRYNALTALADLAGHLPEAQEIHQLLGSMTNDPLPAIAAEAWLFWGLLDPLSGKQANWREAHPAVAAAVLWATLHTNPDQPRPAIEALRDAAVDPAVRAAAAYALHVNGSPQTQQALASVITLDHLRVQGDDQQRDDAWLAWRAILSLRQPPALPEDLLDQPQAHRPLLWAALHQHARLRNESQDPSPSLPDALKPWLAGDRPVTHPVATLAILEGLPPGSVDLGECPPQASPYVKLAWTRATTSPSLQTIRELFGSESHPVRDSACVIAAMRFDDETNMALIASLLSDFNDLAKMSGSMLAGLTNLRPTATINGVTVDLLEHKLEMEDIWRVQQMHRVGLWMQGRAPEVADEIAGLMSRPDMPVSSLLLALAKMKPDAAMNELFSPLTDPPVFKPTALQQRTDRAEPVTLMELFVKYRWLPTLQHVMPDRNLTLWLWADTGLQDFQLQLIRNRWLLTRPTDATAWAEESPSDTPETQPTDSR